MQRLTRRFLSSSTATCFSSPGSRVTLKAPMTIDTAIGLPKVDVVPTYKTGGSARVPRLPRGARSRGIRVVVCVDGSTDGTTEARVGRRLVPSACSSTLTVAITVGRRPGTGAAAPDRVRAVVWTRTCASARGVSTSMWQPLPRDQSCRSVSVEYLNGQPTCGRGTKALAWQESTSRRAAASARLQYAKRCNGDIRSPGRGRVR